MGTTYRPWLNPSSPNGMRKMLNAPLQALTGTVWHKKLLIMLIVHRVAWFCCRVWPCAYVKLKKDCCDSKLKSVLLAGMLTVSWEMLGLKLTVKHTKQNKKATGTFVEQVELRNTILHIIMLSANNPSLKLHWTKLSWCPACNDGLPYLAPHIWVCKSQGWLI